MPATPRRDLSRVLPCEFCDRTPRHCPCIRAAIPLRAAQRAVAARHRDAVERARLTRALHNTLRAAS